MGASVARRTVVGECGTAPRLVMCDTEQDVLLAREGETGRGAQGVDRLWRGETRPMAIGAGRETRARNGATTKGSRDRRAGSPSGREREYERHQTKLLMTAPAMR